MPRHRNNSNGHVKSSPKNDPDYVTFTQELMNSGNWFIFFRPYFKILPKITALFIQDLINRAVCDAHKGRIHDGFFRCTVKRLAKSNWTRDEQQTQFKNLVAAKLITIIHRGVPRRRWVRIEWETIIALLDRFSDSSQ